MFITFSVRASRVGTKATAIYKVGDGCLPATHKTIGPYQKIQTLTYGCLEGVWGQGTLGLIKVGRSVIQVRLKSTGRPSVWELSCNFLGKDAVWERGRITGEVRTCTQEPAKLHNETS